MALSAAKAKKILEDGFIRGKALTEKQKKFFGAIAGGATPLKKINGGWLDKFQNGGDVSFDSVQRAIRNVESLDGKLMWNPESTATGLYGQLFSQVKDDYSGTRKEFAKDTISQKKFFKNRFFEGLPSTQTTSLVQDANDIYNEYASQIPNFNYSKEDLAVLSNFLGRQGTREYLGYHVRDKQPLEKALPNIYGPDAKQRNKTPEQYLKQARKYYKEGGWLDKFDNGGVQPNYNDSNVSLPPGFKGWGYDKGGRAYNGAWDGPVTRMGGSIPGATGMMYARTSGTSPEEPKKAQEGRAMLSQYEEPAWYEKALDYVASPMTTLGYLARGEELPDRLPINVPGRSEYDNWAFDMINPAAYVKYGASAKRNFEKGEYLDSAFDALSAIPIVPAWLSKGKKAKAAIKKGKDIETAPLRELFTQPDIYPTSSPLPKNMEPYLSRKVYPFNKEQEIFESFLPIDAQIKNVDLKSIRYDADGNIIPNMEYGGEIDKASKAKDGGRCWPGYKAVGGKTPFSKGSCQKAEDGGWLDKFQEGGVIEDDRGQWAYPGEITKINSNNITMKGVNYPVLGVSDTGDTKMMQPGKDYKFKGNSVTEFPMARDGKSLVELNQLTNFTNYNTPQPGGWLDKYH